MTAGNLSFYIGGALESHALGSPTGRGVVPTERVKVEPISNDGVISAVNANGLVLSGSRLDLNTATLPLDASPATWSNGEWTVKLVIQSVAGFSDQVRVCWDAYLPASAAVEGRTEPLKRLTCGVYKKDIGARDIGGYVIDDFNGTKTTYSGNW